MGMDVSSSTGVVFEISDVVPNILESLTDAQVKSSVTRLKKKYEDNWPTKKEELDKISSGEDLSNWFLEGIVINEDDEDGFDTYAIENIWDNIMSASKCKLPDATFHNQTVLNLSNNEKLPDATFHYWTSSRLSDYEVPIETPCIVFEEYGLFTTKMTAKGKKLATTLGVSEISTSTWTTLSY